MTWALGPTTGVVEAIDSQGKPFNVGPPPMMGADDLMVGGHDLGAGSPPRTWTYRTPCRTAVNDNPTVASAHHQTACNGACEQGDQPCPHPDDCYAPVDRDLQRVIGWSLIGFWGVLLWWVLS